MLLDKDKSNINLSLPECLTVRFVVWEKIWMSFVISDVCAPPSLHFPVPPGMGLERSKCFSRVISVSVNIRNCGNRRNFWPWELSSSSGVLRKAQDSPAALLMGEPDLG